MRAAKAPEEPLDHVVVLHNLDWETYERIMEAHSDCSAPRFTYDRGELQVVRPSFLHERSKATASLLVGSWADEADVDLLGLGSTTFKRADLQLGFEPDACFYIQHVGLIRGKKEIDLTCDPPPDLMFEIEVRDSFVDRLSIFAKFGAPEVWLYRPPQVTILRLSQGLYVEHDCSECLPGLTTIVLGNC